MVSRRFPLASGALSPPPAPPGARGRPDRPDGDGGRRRDGPLLLAWRGYNDALARTPLRAKAATACVLNVIADLLAQLITGREGQGLDFRRLLRFALFGGVLAGPAGHYWFGALDAAVRTVGMRGAVMKMTADQLLFSPLLLAGFFGVMALMEGKGQVVARQEVEGKLPGTLLTSWKIWPIINLVNFGLIPAPMRVLFVNGLSVFWISFLSVLNGPSAEVKAAVAAS
jgi:protein Mpv17